MLDFLDVCERAEKGPLMTERDFELKVFIPKLRQVVNEYGIRYDDFAAKNPVPADDAAAGEPGSHRLRERLKYSTVV